MAWRLPTKFYILLTMHHVMILVKWPTWCTILFYVFFYIFNSLHVSSTLYSSSGETNCVNKTSGSCHSVTVAMSCAGRRSSLPLRLGGGRLHYKYLSKLIQWTSDVITPPHRHQRKRKAIAYFIHRAVGIIYRVKEMSVSVSHSL